MSSTVNGEQREETGVQIVTVAKELENIWVACSKQKNAFREIYKIINGTDSDTLDIQLNEAEMQATEVDKYYADKMKAYQEKIITSYLRGEMLIETVLYQHWKMLQSPNLSSLQKVLLKRGINVIGNKTGDDYWLAQFAEAIKAKK